MSFAVDKSSVCDQFMDTLSPSQQEKYKKIICERRNIYIGGYLLGLVLSGCYLLMFGSRYSRDSGNYGILCIVAAISFFTSYFFYILYPKSDLMILELNQENQRREWVNIYKKMQYHYHLGIVLGLIAVVFFANGMCK